MTDEMTLSLPELVAAAQEEYEQLQRELKEIDILLKQSTGEVEKLSQRSAQVAGRVQQMEAHLDTYPREDIKNTYALAQEAQMRLFMMRAQVEQLQGKQETLQRYAHQLERFLEVAKHLSEEPASLADAEAEARPLSDRQMLIHIIEAQESERQHLARQMHDGPAQALTNVILQAEICERVFDTDPARARTELANLKNSVNATFQRIRDFIFDLRPMVLDDLGLIPTLGQYVRTFEDKTNIATQLTVMGKERRFAPYAEVTIFRVIQELMDNAWRHAHANHIRIALDLEDDILKATVDDDGSGFDVEEAFASVQERHTLGIATIKERIEMLGGKIQFQSSIGRGTKVSLEIPLQ